MAAEEAEKPKSQRGEGLARHNAAKKAVAAAALAARKEDVIVAERKIEGIEYAARACCTCGRKMARRRNSTTQFWHCIRALNDEGETKSCNINVPSEAILTKEQEVEAEAARSMVSGVLE